MMEFDWFGWLIVTAIVLGFLYLAVPKFRSWVNAKLGVSWNPPKNPPVDDNE